MSEPVAIEHAAELLELLDDVSAIAESMLPEKYWQIVPYTSKTDHERRKEIVAKARALCDRLIRSE